MGAMPSTGNGEANRRDGSGGNLRRHLRTGRPEPPMHLSVPDEYSPIVPK